VQTSPLATDFMFQCFLMQAPFLLKQHREGKIYATQSLLFSKLSITSQVPGTTMQCFAWSVPD
jgi:hypothetical protein